MDGLRHNPVNALLWVNIYIKVVTELLCLVINSYVLAIQSGILIYLTSRIMLGRDILTSSTTNGSCLLKP